MGTEYIGQTVMVTVRPHSPIFDVILGTRVLKSLSIKGLHNQTMLLDDYIALIGQEAEYRQYLASQLRYV